MSSAKIYRFPKPFRRRPVPLAPVRVSHYRGRYVHDGGFALMMFLTVPAASLYLSGAVGVARHDTLYTSLLAAVWGLYFFYPLLLKVRVLGPLLIRAGRLLLIAGVAGFFGGIYWLIYRNG